MRDDAVERVGERRFARARRTGDADERAVGNAQVDALEQGLIPFPVAKRQL